MQIFEVVSPGKAASRPVVIVGSQSVVSVPVDVDGPQVSAEGVVSLKEELGDLAVEVLVAGLLGLSSETSGQGIKVVSFLNHSGTVEVVAQSDVSLDLTGFGDKPGEIQLISELAELFRSIQV